jgi:hypothetical protein
LPGNLPTPTTRSTVPARPAVEPDIRARLGQIRDTVAQLEAQSHEFVAAVFGTGNDQGPAPPIASFEDQLADVATRLACPCGAAATVNQRFGISLDEKETKSLR